jgi:hypothetical protein
MKSAGKERKGGGRRGSYGQFSVRYPNRPKGKQKGTMDTHRFMWLLVNGYVGPNEVICHKCNNKECVNPDHLYSGTQKQNVKDSIDAGTHVSTTWSNFCPQGHEYTQENTYISPGKNGYGFRACRECHRTRQREYLRKKSAGKEHPPKPKKAATRKKHLIGDNEARFLLKIDRTIGGCWNWLAGLGEKGYGQFAVINTDIPFRENGRYVNRRAHSWSYEHFVGPVPKGKVVRHLCHNRVCVRPEHLEVGTHKDNMQDAIAANRMFNQKKTHCKHGHEFTEENTIFRPNPDGRRWRHCRTCRAARKRKMNPSDVEHMFFKDEGLDKSI